MNKGDFGQKDMIARASKR